MKPRVLALTGAGLLAAAGLLSAVDETPDATERSLDVLTAQVEDAGCEPLAPVQVELQPGTMSSGRATIDYTLEARRDVPEMWASVRVLDGGQLRGHSAPLRAAAMRGDRVRGTARIDLPANLEGVRVEIVGHIRIPDASMPDGFLELRNVRRVTYGEPRLETNTTLALTDGEVSVDIPTR